MSSSILRLHEYEPRKQWNTYCLEFYIAFIFCINFVVPLMMKLFDAISMHETFWKFDVTSYDTYFRIFSYQQSELINNIGFTGPLLYDVFEMMSINALMTEFLGFLLCCQYKTYYENRRLMVYEVMTVIVCVQLVSAMLYVIPFVALKTIAYVIGLIGGHYLSSAFEPFRDPFKTPLTLKDFFYIVDEKEEKKEKQ